MAPRYVGIGPSTHRTDVCVGLFPLKSDFGQRSAEAAAFLGQILFSVVCVCRGMPTVRVACRTTAPYSCAAPVALQLAARHRSGGICHTWDGQFMDVVRCMLLAVRGMSYTPSVFCCMSHVACHMLQVASCVLHVACYHLARTLFASSYARTHARATCTRGRSCL